LILLFPLLGFVYLATEEIQRELSLYQDVSKQEELSELTLASSALIKSLQEEINLSTLYLNSGNEDHKLRLSLHWNKTNSNIKEFKTLLSKINAESYGQDFEAATGWAQGKIDEVNYIRKHVIKVSQQSEGRKRIRNILNRYDFLISLLMDVITASTRQSTNALVSNASAAYINLLQSNGQFVLQRAILNNTLANSSFENGLYEKLLEALNEEKTYQKVFISFADDKQVEAFQNVLFSDTGTATKEFINHAVTRGNNDTLEIDQKQWEAISESMTYWLNSLETDIKNSLNAIVTNLKQKTLNTLKAIITISISAFLLSTLMSISMIRVIHRQLSNLHTTMDSVANDANLAIRAEKICADEMGQMAADLNFMLGKLNDLLKKMDAASVELTAYEGNMQYYTQQLTDRHYEDLLDIELIQNIRKELLDLDEELSESLSDKQAFNNIHSHLDSVCHKLLSLGEIEEKNQQNKMQLKSYGQKLHTTTHAIRRLMDRFHQ